MTQWLVTQLKVASLSAESRRQGTSSAVSQSTKLDLVQIYAGELTCDRLVSLQRVSLWSLNYPVSTKETGNKHLAGLTARGRIHNFNFTFYQF